MVKHTIGLLCVLLATDAVSIQEKPQRIERVVEYRWCEFADSFVLTHTLGFRIEGVTGLRDTKEDVLWRINRQGGPPPPTKGMWPEGGAQP